MNKEMERAFGWDDQITKDAEEFIVLPEGDYDFVVSRFERGYFNGSEKMSACPQAILFLKVAAPDGQSVELRHNLFLHSKAEWKLSEFFAAIGQKKKNVPLRMNWNLVPGSSGKCKISTRQYNNNTYNEIKKFYPKEDSNVSFNPGTF